MTLSFKDNADGYYEFADDAPTEWYAHLIPCEKQVINKTIEEIILALEDGVQIYLDSKAVQKGYKDAERLISYKDSSNPTWKSEALAMNQWRDDVWNYCLNLEHTATAPMTLDELKAQLPAAPW